QGLIEMQEAKPILLAKVVKPTQDACRETVGRGEIARLGRRRGARRCGEKKKRAYQRYECTGPPQHRATLSRARGRWRWGGRRGRGDAADEPGENPDRAAFRRRPEDGRELRAVEPRRLLRRADLPPGDRGLHDPGRLPARRWNRRPRLHVRGRA